MVKTLLTWLRAVFLTRPVLTQGRSGRWAAVRANYLEKNDVCAACGKSKALEVHHVIPVHINPDLELSEDNLITLCRTTCHLLIGHLGDWHNSNKHVREDAAHIFSRVLDSKN